MAVTPASLSFSPNAYVFSTVRLITFDRFSGPLAELYVNPVERGVEDISILKSVGTDRFDLAVAKGVFGKAEEMKLGEEIFL